MGQVKESQSMSTISVPLGVKSIVHFLLHLLVAYEPDLMLKLASRRRPYRRSLQAVFGSRARLCQALNYSNSVVLSTDI